MTWAQRIRALLVGFIFTCLFLGASCDLKPTPTPGGAGGYVPATGGASSGGWQPIDVGGVPSVAGAAGAATGGVTAAGGASPIAVVWPSCNESLRAPLKVRPPMKGWRKDKARTTRPRWRPTYQLVTGTHSVFWQPLVERALDQGSIGSCTGNAIAQCLSTRPFGARLTEDDALRIYTRATQIDPWDGEFPGQDTGSNGSSAWQAAVDLGYYHGTFAAVDTLEELQVAVQSVTCALGTPWYDGFFSPARCGEMSITGAVAGGHEIQIIGWDSERKVFWIRNSWGDWGLSRGRETGFAYFSAGTLQKLLTKGAEIDCPLPP